MDKEDYFRVENQLVTVVNNTFPIARKVKANPPIVKLTREIEEVIRKLYDPKIKFRNGTIEVIEEDIEQNKQNEILLTNYEIVKLKGFLTVAEYACNELNDSNPSTNSYDGIDEDLDFDWLMRFFDSVGLINNQDLQKLWGKILAGEVRSPGLCSLRTLDIIRNLSRDEAKSFDKLSKYVMQSGNIFFIFDNGFSSPNIDEDEYNVKSFNLIKSQKLSFVLDIVPLIESGLFTIDQYFASNFSESNSIEIHNDKLLYTLEAQEKGSTIKFEPYILTKSGIELFRVIHKSKSFITDTEYANCCIEELQKKYTDIKFSIMPFTDN